MTETLAAFLLAIAIVESNCNDDAIGTFGEVGRYQISQRYLNDVNKILNNGRIRYGVKEYTLNDMKDSSIATFVVMTYLNAYRSIYTNRNGKLATFEVLARIHNGGPLGYQLEHTKKYWEKVKMEMERLNAN